MRVAAVVFGVTSTVMLGTIALTYSTGNRVLQLQREEDDRRRALLAIDDLFSILQDAETGQRGFIITGDENYLRPFNEARDKLPDAFGRLSRGAKPSDDISVDVEELRKVAEQKLAELMQTIETRRIAGLAAAASIVESGTGRALMDQIRTLVARMREGQADQLRKHIDASTSATRLRTWMFIISGVLNVLVLVWGFERIRRAMNERNRAVFERQREADLLSTTLASIGDCVIVTDQSGRITFMNAVACAVTGWEEAEAMGRPVREIFKIINEHSRAPVEDPVEKVIEHGVVVGLANHTVLIRKDRSEVPIDDSGAPIRAPNGELEGVVLVFRDFSAHKQAERDLRQAKEAAEIASETKDKFLAMLSHELRTPLTPVLSTLNLWEMSEGLPSSLRGDVVMMRRNVDLEARIIDDLLDLTRVSRGLITMASERVDVHSVLKLLIDITRSDVTGKDIKLVQNLEAGRHFVVADSARLQQVVWNLLRNAINFTDPNGTITVSTADDGDQIAISVQDSGIGMTAETLDRLFTPFEQGDQRRSRVYGGLGLGLSISYALVNKMGGTLAAESAGVGRGSVFTVKLNTVDAAVPVDVGPAQPASKQLSKRILVVEDHLDAAMALTRLLRVRGHHIRVASSMAAALSELESHPFDLIICDIGLPDGTGYDLINTVRKTKPIAAIALTGFGMSSDVDRAIAAGFDSHLTKPVNFLKLEATMADLLSREPAEANSPS